MPPERTASASSPGGDYREFTCCFAYAAALRIHDESTWLQVV